MISFLITAIITTVIVIIIVTFVITFLKMSCANVSVSIATPPVRITALFISAIPTNSIKHRDNSKSTKEIK